MHTGGVGWSRMRRVARRVLLDGRLPEPVEHLVTDAARHRVRKAVGQVARRCVPGGEDAPTVPCSRFELRHRCAGAVVDALEAGGLAPFLVDADDVHLTLGLRLEERDLALTALRRALGDGWVIAWRRGHRVGSGVLAAPLPAVVERAEWWEVFRPYRAGDEVVGAAEAVQITFWARADDRYERLGKRGLHRFRWDERSVDEVVDGRRYPGLECFPVGRRLTAFRDPIDVVVTWVDGSDPAWRATFDRWRTAGASGAGPDHATAEGRYRSRDELRYALRSLWLNAGWVRRIFVVTASQRPSWLVEDDRLRVVDHREIFPSAWLPTFNSHAIEARLHHVQGLSEHFLYLNDDMFLGRPLARDRFFTSNGLPRFFESEALVPTGEPPADELAADSGARNGRALVEADFGSVPRAKLHHAPYALRRSVLAEIEARYPEVVERTARSRFRHPSDLSIPSGFAHHYAYCTGRAVVGRLDVAYEYIENPRLPLFLDRVLSGRDLDAFCLNESERPVRDREAVDRAVHRFLERYFPVPSPWEADP